MPETIQRLPDHIANQIAAGEVIQRPASAVKELLENAVDAGASTIRLIIRDAGKELVQVIDDGCGMGETDAGKCFERHATSKISRIEDLFHIHTMGFRGEALASIAAVAQVELKTRAGDSQLGTYLEITHSQIQKKEPVAWDKGTSIAMKNLFFSVPARRHFLKSNATEMRHIVDEFLHVALAFPGITFTFEANGQELYHLTTGSIKQRVLQVLGNQYHERLVAVREQTDYLDVSGFVGKPEAAKKTRGDQYFFVNKRFIRSGYLHHALMGAFAGLIAPDSHPMYLLFIELDPTRIDINVHPTKQEIKFEDERLIYAFIQSAVKHALARFSITPTLDFSLDANIQQLSSVTQPFTEEKKNQAAGTDLFRTFTQKNQAHVLGGQDYYRPRDPRALTADGRMPPMPQMPPSVAAETENTPDQADSSELWQGEEPQQRPPQQIHGRYILQQIKSGFILIDQQAAHERVLYERYQQALQREPLPSQQSLFPEKLDLSHADAVLLEEMLPELKALGYDIQPAGPGSFAMHGIPGDLESGGTLQSIEVLLEQFKYFSTDISLDKREKMTRSLAAQHALRPGTSLTAPEMQNLIDRLFACRQPQVTPGGKGTFLIFRLDELARMFDN